MADYFNTSIDYIVGHTDVRRKIEYTEVFHLNKTESELIMHFRSLQEYEKSCIDMTIKAFLRK